MSILLNKSRFLFPSILSLLLFLSGCDSNSEQDTLFLFIDQTYSSTYGVVLVCRHESQDDWSIQEKGLYWGALPDPEVTGTYVNGGTGMGPFTCVLNGLPPGATYYAKYVVRYKGGTISEPDGEWNTERRFGTLAHKKIEFWPSGTVNDSFTDAEGNTYKTFTIGTQTWMAENLKVRKFRNGVDIPTITSDADWQAVDSAASCDYFNAPGHSATYGRLYNWYAVNSPQNICPAGWHIPTDDEWKQLEVTLGMNQEIADYSGERGTNMSGKLREYSSNHWVGGSPNNSNTLTGFTALPAGLRDENGAFLYLEKTARWWTSTEFNAKEAWFRGLSIEPTVLRNSADKRFGYSIRCVKD